MFYYTCVWDTYLVDDIAVLSVHHGDGAEALADLERLDQLGIAQHEEVAVGHEELEAVHAVLLDERRHLLPRLHAHQWKKERPPMELIMLMHMCVRIYIYTDDVFLAARHACVAV